MIVLDTHTWLWWISNPRLLSFAARKAIDRAVENDEVNISSISAWEVAVLVKKGRLELTLLPEDWIARSEAIPYVHFIPVDNRIAMKSVQLPGPLHDDPADRIIIATTMSIGGILITKDERMLKYRHVKTLW